MSVENPWGRCYSPPPFEGGLIVQSVLIVVGVVVVIAIALLLLKRRAGIEAPPPRAKVPPPGPEVSSYAPEAPERDEAPGVAEPAAEAPPEPIVEPELVATPGPAPESPPEAEAEPEHATIYDGLRKTRSEGFIARLKGLLGGGAGLGPAQLDALEEVLFTADIGVQTADALMERVKGAMSSSEPEARMWEVLEQASREILQGAAAAVPAPNPRSGAPHVVMVLGVNGSGKTTTIGKLAHQALAEERTVGLVAADTFRAAAAEQLERWGSRVGAPVHRGKEGADPASVAFDGVKRFTQEGLDLVLVDTAGRLHTQVNLMEELKKVRRVVGKAFEGAPHEVLLVLDATTGQNAITQAHEFHGATEVSGIALTKLDGTAKGGVVLGVCDELKIPVRYVGVGERVGDLRPFDAEAFVSALFDDA